MVPKILEQGALLDSGKAGESIIGHNVTECAQSRIYRQPLITRGVALPPATSVKSSDRINPSLLHQLVKHLPAHAVSPSNARPADPHPPPEQK